MAVIRRFESDLVEHSPFGLNYSSQLNDSSQRLMEVVLWLLRAG